MRIVKAEIIEQSLEKAEQELRFLKRVLKEPYPPEVATQIAEKEGIVYILVQLLRETREVPDLLEKKKQQ